MIVCSYIGTLLLIVNVLYSPNVVLLLLAGLLYGAAMAVEFRLIRKLRELSNTANKLTAKLILMNDKIRELDAKIESRKENE